MAAPFCRAHSSSSGCNSARPQANPSSRPPHSSAAPSPAGKRARKAARRLAASPPKIARWIGSNTSASSYTLTISTSAQRASGSPESSQQRRAAASEWLPSPTAKASPSFSSARAASSICAFCAPSTRQPRMCPPPCIRSKSYSSSNESRRAYSGSMSVRPGSSARSMACGVSRGAFSRIFTRGGMRSRIVPSVARMRGALPGR